MNNAQSQPSDDSDAQPILAPGQDYLGQKELASTIASDARRRELHRIFTDMGADIPPPVQYAPRSSESAA